MKKFTSIAIAFLLVLSVIPAMAADQTGGTNEPVMSPAVDTAPVPFQALSKLSATERKDLTPLTDTELAAVEGHGFFVMISACSGGGIYCTNSASVYQRISIGAWNGQVAASNVGPAIQNNGITVSFGAVP